MADDHDDNPASEAVTREVVAAIGDILAGLGPDVQGSVLANLVALYLCGWPESARAIALETIVDHARQLLPHYARKVHGEAGHPDDAASEPPAAEEVH